MREATNRMFGEKLSREVRGNPDQDVLWMGPAAVPELVKTVRWRG